jgi:hypothetical protein
MNPTAAGVMNNMVIGGTTPLAGTFTTLRVNSTLSLAGSTGTSGYVMTSNGASAPTWSALPASGITITDDTTTNATRYLAFTSATSGTITGQNVSSTKLAFNPSTGRFGIGISTPTTPLDVSGASGTQARFKTTGNYGGVVADNTSATGGGFFSAYQNGVAKTYFGVAGAILGDTTSDAALWAESGLNIRFYTNGATPEKMRLSSAGGLGVGTTADPGAGGIYATGNITAYYSDDRLKTKLGKIENALDKVCELDGFYYEANETAQALGYKVKREVGVSAQSVQKVMPEIVSPAPIDDQYLTIDYSKLTPMLIEAIKELKAEIELLKAK